MALSVAQLYEVMAQLPDPVFILSEDGYYIEYIGGMEQQSHQNGNPLIGRQLLDVLPEDKAQWVMAQVAQALASGQVQVVDDLPRRGGRHRRRRRAPGNAAFRGQDSALALYMRGSGRWPG